jgi:hypothetical protein
MLGVLYREERLMNQRLREEQDMAYQQALEQDREKVASAPEGWHFLGFRNGSGRRIASAN